MAACWRLSGLSPSPDERRAGEDDEDAENDQGGGRLLFLLIAAVLLLSVVPLTQAYAKSYSRVGELTNAVKAQKAVVSAGETIDTRAAGYPATYAYYDEGGQLLFKDSPGKALYTVQGGDYNDWRVYFYEVEDSTYAFKLSPAFGVLLDSAGLQGATATLDAEIADTKTEIKLTITPDAGKDFKGDLTVDAGSATAGAPAKNSDGAYECIITDFSEDTIVAVSGEAKGHDATLVKDDLKHAGASLSKTEDIGADETVTLTVTPDANYAFPGALRPTVSVENATAGDVTKNSDGTITCTISAFTDDATVTVSGEAKKGATATLVTNGLKGATATLSKDSGIFAVDGGIDVRIVPEANKKFASAPVVTASVGTVTPMQAQMDGSYYCQVEDITADTVITVTGEAKADDSKPSIKINGETVHPIGSGQSFTATCSLPLDELIEVYVDGKVLDKANYELRSGSTIITLKAAYLDSLSVGKHTLRLSYTEDRDASVDFTVAKAGTGGNGGNGGKIAKTGDPLSAAPLAAAAGVSGIALIAAGAALRKKAAQK